MDDFVSRGDVLALLATRKPKVTYRGKFEPSHKSPQSVAVMEERKRLADAIKAMPRADLAQAPAPVLVKALARAHGIDKDVGWTLPIDTLCEIRDEMKPSGYGGGVCLEEVELIALATEARILAPLEAPDAGVVAELVEAAKGLKAIVEEIRGAMEHGTWRDEKGQRLKDTPEWVTIHNAIAKLETRA